LDRTARLRWRMVPEEKHFRFSLLRISEAGLIVKELLRMTWTTVVTVAQGKECPIRVETTLSSLGKGQVEIVMKGVPQGVEKDVCSACMHVSVSSDFGWTEIKTNLKVSLPSADSTWQENLSLFQKPPNNMVERCDSFELGCGNISVVFSCFEQRVQFLDVRKWGPSYDIRVGDSEKQPFDWSEAKEWHVIVTFVGTTISIPEKFHLSEDVKTSIKRDGFYKFSKMVDPSLIAAALRKINGNLSNLDTITKDQVFVNLFRLSPIRSVIDSLIKRVPDWAGSACQIALIFPAEKGDSNAKPEAFGYHIDGFGFLFFVFIFFDYCFYFTDFFFFFFLTTVFVFFLFKKFFFFKLNFCFSFNFCIQIFVFRIDFTKQ
jgi:hypothetical protein